jgi:hypothetical protein
MDDISVFRRFFVMSNLLTEIIAGLSGGGMPSSGVSDKVNTGPDPFNPKVQDQVQQNQENELLNQTYGFPTGS